MKTILTVWSIVMILALCLTGGCGMRVETEPVDVSGDVNVLHTVVVGDLLGAMRVRCSKFLPLGWDDAELEQCAENKLDVLLNDMAEASALSGSELSIDTHSL